MKIRFLTLVALGLAGLLQPFDASLDPSKVLGPISDLTYGSNQPLNAPYKVMRQGGNRYTGYNWEANVSNAGADWKHSSDTWLNTSVGLKDAPMGPAAIPLEAVAKDRAAGRQTILTVPMAGYVAADSAGPVEPSQAAPSKRWAKVAPRKGGAFAAAPDLKDGIVYVDEFIAYLKSKNSAAQVYCLDNEPGLWKGTHPLIHPKPATYAEMAEKSAATAAAVLSQQPGALIAGGVTYGYNEIRKLQDAPDYAANNARYGSYLAYYLAKMKEASDKQGKRLLHLIDNHWYPEARGGNQRITEGKDPNNKALVQARLQAPRSLWDPAYKEDSWVSNDVVKGPIALIPYVKAAIDKYYPGTQMAFLEWNYGGDGDISGGLAAADVLGIFGKNNAAACYWKLNEQPSFVEAAFKLYLDFDGKGSRFGDTALDIASPDAERLSLHAAKDSKNPKRVTLVAVHKDMAKAGELKLALAGAAGVRAFRLEGKNAALKPVKAALSAQGLSDKLPSLSATVYEITLK